MLDAYTIRKAIPRIVIAVIAINLSIYLCVAALDIATIVGKGLNQILVTPFVSSNSFSGIGIESNVENDITGVVGLGILTFAIGGIFASGGAVALEALGLILPLIITVVLMSLAILFTLVIWQALIIFLTVISPVAIACYILPGTEKYFRQWWDLFLRTLVVFPIIAVFFAMSNVMASILLNASRSSGDGIGVVQVISVVVVVFAPLILIPFAFKMAGGLISQVGQFAGGQASGISRRAGQAIKQNRQDPSSWLGKGRLASKSNRVERGYTTRSIFAGRPGGDRPGRLRAARDYERKKIRGEKEGSDLYKAYAQDSDVQDSLVMSEAQVAQDRQNLQQQLATGQIGQAEYDRRMGVHAIGDQIGRSQATRQAAFLNSERLKFLEASGPQGHAQEMALARELFEDESSVVQAMNQHQFVAKQVNRGDLAGSVNAGAYDLDRVTGQLDPYRLSRERPAAIASYIDSHLTRMQDPNATAEERARSAAFLVKAQNTVGMGNEEVDNVINQNQEIIGNTLRGHYTSVANERANNGMPPPQDTVLEGHEERTIPDPANPGSFITTRVPVRRQATAREEMDFRVQEVEQETRRAAGARGQLDDATIANLQNQQNNQGSDFRIKDDITFLMTYRRINIYKFRYIWSDQFYVGVIAQEIIETHPDAVSVDPSGYLMVNYTKLGIDMIEYDQWLIHQKDGSHMHDLENSQSVQ